MLPLTDDSPGAADQRREFPAEDFVAEAKFAAAAGVIAEIETAAGALVAEDGDAGLAGELVAGKLGREGVGCNEEMGVAQGLVKLRGSQVAGAEQEVVTPFSAVMFDVHERNAGAGGEIEGGDAGAVDVDRQIHEGRAVVFLVRHDAQSGNTVLHEAFVAQALELAIAGDAGQARVELIQIEGLMEKALKPPLQVPLLVATHAGDLKKVRGGFGLAFPGFALRQVLLPFFVRQSVFSQLGGVVGRALISQMDDLVGMREVEDGERTQVGRDLGIGETQGAAVVPQGHDVDRLGEKTGYALEILASDQRRTDVHSDDDVCVHLASDIGGNVIDQPTIGEDLAVEFHGREQAGNGHGRAQGLGQGAILENDGVSAEHVGGNAAKRDGQIVEAGRPWNRGTRCGPEASRRPGPR